MSVRDALFAHSVPFLLNCIATVSAALLPFKDDLITSLAVTVDLAIPIPSQTILPHWRGKVN